ncbi:riboflavin biosynthesis protein RibF [Agrilactobacillus fermenti]|uniref:riboflavin biosynthesis protein RibF n=1 Tax=Agrilactobacillus fermenti TaxID=2586909 RepID=UPI001E2E8F5C|nr:riboflavin biosynthesis protein RibF [Agrilactobacillus fermenti]MCD2257380.1 riboflavin biosynthesis protein RibF [Agrilactobacillus fermenti]
MQIVHLHHPYDTTKIINQSIVLALGFFDGVHRGHQAVIKRGKEIAETQNLPLAVMTFNQHPAIVFEQVGPQGIQYLSPLKRKAELMAQLGVDIFYIVDFTSNFANLSPQAFVDQYIIGLHAKFVVAGFDYTFGKQAVANMTTMPKFSHHQFEIETVSEEDDADLKISSTRIRKLLSAGAIDEANHLLGYTYETQGLVVHGLARGRTLGYPTANVITSQAQQIPGIGIYSVQINVNNHWYEAMASVGYNITFDETKTLTLEVNIFDFDEFIYGEQVKIRWYHYLRGEIKFSGAEALVAQLDQDKIATQKYFATQPKKEV